MIRVEIKLESGNAAFGDTAEEAVSEALRSIRDSLNKTERELRNQLHDLGFVFNQSIRDINGNRVGEITVKTTTD